MINRTNQNVIEYTGSSAYPNAIHNIPDSNYVGKFVKGDLYQANDIVYMYAMAGSGIVWYVSMQDNPDTSMGAINQNLCDGVNWNYLRTGTNELLSKTTFKENWTSAANVLTDEIYVHNKRFWKAKIDSTGVEPNEVNANEWIELRNLFWSDTPLVKVIRPQQTLNRIENVEDMKANLNDFNTLNLKNEALTNEVNNLKNQNTELTNEINEIKNTLVEVNRTLRDTRTFKYVGEYDPATTYEKSEAVSNGQKLFVSKIDNNRGNEPTLTDDNWLMIDDTTPTDLSDYPNRTELQTTLMDYVSNSAFDNAKQNTLALLTGTRSENSFMIDNKFRAETQFHGKTKYLISSITEDDEIVNKKFVSDEISKAMGSNASTSQTPAFWKGQYCFWSTWEIAEENINFLKTANNEDLFADVPNGTIKTVGTNRVVGLMVLRTNISDTNSSEGNSFYLMIGNVSNSNNQPRFWTSANRSNMIQKSNLPTDTFTTNNDGSHQHALYRQLDSSNVSGWGLTVAQKNMTWNAEWCQSAGEHSHTFKLNTSQTALQLNTVLMVCILWNENVYMK